METNTQTPSTLTVALGERSYPIHIGSGLIAHAGQLLAALSKQKRAFIISNETIAPHYLATLRESLAQSGFESAAMILPDGERYKNWEELEKILTWLLESHAERNSPLLALGGGVVGDITGLAAALYQRGMPLIQIPTSLLAQVDSSVGGKTAVNHRLGKNMIGAFHQPSLVLIDIATLTTLADREYISGIAEVIKYGAIYDRDFFDWLEQHAAELKNRDEKAIRYAVQQSCRIKAAVVAADERESGIRAWLNLGHTFGHAIETALGYGTWLHGEAVAVGMAMAARLSVAVCGLKQEDANRLIALIQAVGLPTTPPELPRETWLELMLRDKKTQGGKLRLVLLERLGKAVIRGDIGEAGLKFEELGSDDR